MRAPLAWTMTKRRGKRAWRPAQQSPCRGRIAPLRSRHLRRLLGHRRQDDLVPAQELVARALDRGERLLEVVDPDGHLEVARRGEAAADDLPLDPGAQAAPHRPDEDERAVAQHV